MPFDSLSTFWPNRKMTLYILFRLYDMRVVSYVQICLDVVMFCFCAVFVEGSLSKERYSPTLPTNKNKSLLRVL